MSNLVKFYENDNDIMYSINGSEQGLVSIPKDLNNNIKVYMIFKDSVLQDYEKNKLMIDIQSISKIVNKNSNDAILIVSLINNDFLLNENIINYGNQLVKIKKLVNDVYNEILKKKNLKRENFIKKLEIVALDNKYRDFSNWLCMQNPLKFGFINYQDLFINENNNNKIAGFSNQNSANIFNEPNKQSTMMGMQSNIRPTYQSLSIGTPKFVDDTSSGGGPVNFVGQTVNFSTNKTLVKKPPNNGKNAAFIKWYTVLFILLASLVIGITISLILVK